MNYYWVRMFNYNKERDGRDKGIKLDEYYLKGEELTKEEAKKLVKNKSNDPNIKFAKPRKGDGIYFIVMDSSKSYYDWFCKEIDTICFFCHKPIKGMMRAFKRINIPRNGEKEIDIFADDKEDSQDVYFCSNECYCKYYKNITYELDYQNKQEKMSDTIIGYIYHIYNKKTNKHYIGQTKFIPTFRWTEHIKSKTKGNILDLVFDVITEVKKVRGEDNQEVLNNIEAWWINKYKDEGYDIYNINTPTLSMTYYKNKYNKYIAKNPQLELPILK